LYVAGILIGFDAAMAFHKRQAGHLRVHTRINMGRIGGNWYLGVENKHMCLRDS